MDSRGSVRDGGRGWYKGLLRLGLLELARFPHCRAVDDWYLLSESMSIARHGVE